MGKRAVSSTGPLTIRTYLDELAARVPQAELRYRYAWDERPAAGVGLWAGYGAAARACLALVRRLVHGPAPARQKIVSLRAGVSAASPAPVRPEPPAVDATRDGEGAEASAPAGPVPAPHAGPVPTLLTEEVEGPAPAVAEEKHFGGEFYPTEAHAERR